MGRTVTERKIDSGRLCYLLVLFHYHLSSICFSLHTRTAMHRRQHMKTALMCARMDAHTQIHMRVVCQCTNNLQNIFFNISV